MNYKPRTTINRFVCLFLCLTLLSVATTGCSKTKESSKETQNEETETEESQSSSETSDSDDAVLSENPRSEYEAKLVEVEELYTKDPDDQDTAIQYSQILYKLGDFDEAQEVLIPYLNEENPSPDIIYLSAQIEYLKGNYSEAENLYKTLVEEYYDEYGMEAETGLQMVYYQTNEYSKASQLFVGQDIENPLLDMMKAFDETPYQLNWNGNEQTTIPFVTTDPLVVVPIEINGVKMNAFIDTGGSTLMVDEAVAADLGIDSISNESGTVAGGTIDYSFGKTDSMKLGDVDIKNVPVTLLSFEGISDAFEDYATNVHAIIGTNVLQQFISTIDYTTGQLILMPRHEACKEKLGNMLANNTVLEQVPFTLASTHFMYTKGSINGYEGLNMFVDSGGADEKGTGIFFIKETLEFLNIPLPDEMTSSTTVGPDAFEAGWVDISSYGLGKLEVKQSVGYYDTSGHSDDLSDTNGFIHDALINHDYLKKYKWTIDFDAMEMTFSK